MNLVTRPNHAIAVDRRKHLERATIEHHDSGAPSDVQEPLFRVGRQGQIPCERHVTADYLVDELAVEREDLNASIFTIRHIHHPVVRHTNSMNDAQLRWTGTIGHRVERNVGAMVVVFGYVAECAPHAFEDTGVRVEDGYAVIAVSISDEQFVCIRVNKCVRRLV